METNKALAKITITPTADPKISHIHVDTPVWIRKSEDGKLYADIALFGGIKTYGDNEADLDVAINEALTCFFIFAKKHGKGIHAELNFLGWQTKNPRSMKFKVKHKDRQMVTRSPKPATYDINPKQPGYQQMMMTGVSKSVSLSI